MHNFYKINIIILSLLLIGIISSSKNFFDDSNKNFLEGKNNISFDKSIIDYTIGNWADKKRPFNGLIISKRITKYDTVKTFFYVSDTIVRIDEFNINNNIMNTLIYDFNKKEYCVLNDKVKKVKFIKIKKHNTTIINIKKTKMFKYINGYKCFLWKYKLDNKIYSHWVTGKNFEFFTKLKCLYFHKDNLLSTFSLSADIDGVMPMLSEERTKLRGIIKVNKIIKIEEKCFDKSIYEIPKDYEIIH